MKTVYLSLGANLGDREANLRRAVARLGAAEIRVLRVSSIYETEPQNLKDQPWFLNLAVEAETELFPRQVLRRLQQVERELGRVRTVPKGPRAVDIDILLFGDFVVQAPDLRIPHPRMCERRFVLEPLAELVPDLRHPESRRTVRELLAGVTGQVVRKFAG